MNTDERGLNDSGRRRLVGKSTDTRAVISTECLVPGLCCAIVGRVLASALGKNQPSVLVSLTFVLIRVHP